MTNTLKVQLIRPNVLNQNSSYLFFELDEKERFNYKKDIAEGIASDVFYEITKDYVVLKTGNQNFYRDLHKVLNAEDKYLIVDSDNWEGSKPIADIYTKEQIIKILKATEEDEETFKEFLEL